MTPLHRLRRPLAAALLLTAFALPAALAPGARAGDGDAPDKGRIVPGPRSAHAFNPVRRRTHVDAADIDLRAVFEDLGPDATRWYQHVTTLSNPFFEGRAAGSRGFELATEYVEYWYRRIGLEPAFPADGDGDGAWTSYEQPFTYAGRQRPTFTLSDEHMRVGDVELEHGTDYAVLGPSGGDTVTAPITFVGYGIDEGPDGYSSFDADADLTGRIALVFRYEPVNDDGKSRWDDRRFSEHASMRRKIRSVVDRHPAGIIVVTPTGLVDAAEGLESMRSSAFWARALEIPMVQVTPKVADALLAAGDEGQARHGDDLPNLTAWRRQADDGSIHTVPLDDALVVTFGGHVSTVMEEAEGRPSANVGGVLRGRGRLADEWVIMGGHYDHLGERNGVISPGADDNASGTAGVLILAERFAREYAEAGPDEDRRSILFMAFGAEEAGLLGSRHWAQHPTLDADETSLMINLDMIGRLGDELNIEGTATAEEFDEMLIRHVEPTGIVVAATPAGSGPSDHTNFYGNGIPVLFFFTGVHDEYHRPGDKGYTVDPIGAMQVLDLVQSIAEDVASRPSQLTYRSGQ